jgi:hypothetical protein
MDRSAEFIVAINFDLDGLATVISEQHNDTVVELILLVASLKGDPGFTSKLISALQV